MKSKLFKGLRIIGYLIGFSVLLYPAISNYVNVKNATKVITNYDDEVLATSDEQKEKMLELAQAYNMSLQNGTMISDPFSGNDKSDEMYQQLLNLNGNEMMGYIRIPKIKVELPIYHGTSEPVLQVGVGHLSSTSLPIGGASSHAVLTGHRGLPSAKLFTELDKMENGDVFYIKVLGNTLAYQVDQILTVLPNELDALNIVAGGDYVTLVTCTPYAVNTHRLLVRGVRIDYEEAIKTVKDEEVGFELPFEVKALLIGLIMLMIIIFVIKKYKQKRG